MTTQTMESNQNLSHQVESTQSFISDFQTALETVGERYQIYEAMSQTGPVTPLELAGFISLPESHTRIWLEAQAAAGWLYYSAPSDRYCLWCLWTPRSANGNSSK